MVSSASGWRGVWVHVLPFAPPTGRASPLPAKSNQEYIVQPPRSVRQYTQCSHTNYTQCVPSTSSVRHPFHCKSVSKQAQKPLPAVREETNRSWYKCKLDQIVKEHLIVSYGFSLFVKFPGATLREDVRHRGMMRACT